MKETKVNLLSLVKRSSYQYSDSNRSVNDLACEKIGFFRYKGKNTNTRIASTPNIALSPIVGDLSAQSFLIFITDVHQSSIDIWKCTKEYKCSMEFQGRIPVEGLVSRSAIAAEHAGKDLKRIHGDITYFNFYVSCEAKSTIHCFSLPTNAISCEVEEVVASNICHEDLKKPTDMAVHTNHNGKTKIAVINHLCGRIFLFTKESNFNFVLLQIVSPHESLSTPTSICFDLEGKLWISNSSCLLVCPNNEETFTVALAENSFKALSRSEEDVITELHSSEDGVLLGCSAKLNRVGMVKVSDSHYCLNGKLGPCNTYRPLHLAYSFAANVLLVTERKRTSNEPQVSLFQFAHQ